MPIPREKKCPECSSTMTYQDIKDTDHPLYRDVEYKCQSCKYCMVYKTKKIRRREFDFGPRSYLPIWCDDVVLVEPEPHAVIRRPDKLIAVMALCVIHLLWKETSTKSHELVRHLTNVALRSGYLAQEDLVDENILEEESAETDR